MGRLRVWGSPLRFVVLLGIVSLFADVTYEGARSSSGPFLAELGASAAVVGVVAGLGELVGYGLRLLSGWAADRTKRYWTFLFLGYALNVLSVPLLFFAREWPQAGSLLVLERAGKAIRTPSRDALLSSATTYLGRGWGFGIHEALDQIGALLGPLLVAGALAVSGSLRLGFALLALPALLSLLVLLLAWKEFPHALPEEPPERSAPPKPQRSFGRSFWNYTLGASLVAAGFVDFPLLAFHFHSLRTVPDEQIPILYALGMGVAGVGALVSGALFDRWGLRTLAGITLLGSLFSPLAFWGGEWGAWGGILLWGIALGAHESLMKAAVAGMVAPDTRASAYGVFDLFFGVSWFLGSALLGVLYERSIEGVVLLSFFLQIASIPFFLSLKRV